MKRETMLLKMLMKKLNCLSDFTDCFFFLAIVFFSLLFMFISYFFLFSRLLPLLFLNSVEECRSEEIEQHRNYSVSALLLTIYRTSACQSDTLRFSLELLNPSVPNSRLFAGSVPEILRK